MVRLLISFGRTLSKSVSLINSPFSLWRVVLFMAVATHTLTQSLFSRTQRTPLKGRLLLGFGGVRRFDCCSGIGQSRRFICTSSCKCRKLQMASHSSPRLETGLHAISYERRSAFAAILVLSGRGPLLNAATRTAFAAPFWLPLSRRECGNQLPCATWQRPNLEYLLMTSSR
jgi:hypothetical protein